MTIEDIVRMYGLDPLPESVQRLTELVAKQDVHLDVIADIVRQDRALTARVLRAANPHASQPEQYAITSVKQALLRSGMRCVLILAMGDPIVRAVGKTFRTMLGIEKVALVNTNAVEGLTGEHVQSEISFTGRALGMVQLRLSERTAGRIALRLLGLDPTTALERAEIDDVLRELTNIVAGNFQSNVRDAGLPCQLSPPVVRRTSSFQLHSVPGGASERMTFATGDFNVFVDLSINPWNE